jgi:hypothetical protein
MIAKLNLTVFTAIMALVLSLGAVGAKATNLITNGSFESLSGGIGQIGYNGTSLTGWTNGSYGNTVATISFTAQAAPTRPAPTAIPAM